MIEEKERIDLTTLTGVEKRRLNDSVLRVLLILTADGRKNRDTFTIARYAYFADDSLVRELVEEHLFERNIVVDGYSIDHRRHSASVAVRTLRSMRNGVVESASSPTLDNTVWELASATKAVCRIFGKRRIKDQVRRVALRHVLDVEKDNRFDINKARNSACKDKSLLAIVDRIPSYLREPRSEVARHMFTTRMAMDGLNALQAMGIIRQAGGDDLDLWKIDSVLEAMAHTYADDGDLIDSSDDIIL